MDDFNEYQQYADEIKKYNLNSVTKFIEVIFMAINFIVIFANMNFRIPILTMSLCILGSLSGIYLIVQFIRLLHTDVTNKSVSIANSLNAIILINIAIISMFIIIVFYLFLMSKTIKIPYVDGLAKNLFFNNCTWVVYVLQVYYDFAFFLIFVPKISYKADNIVNIVKNNNYLHFLSSNDITKENNIIFINQNRYKHFKKQYIPITENIRNLHVNNLLKLSKSSVNQLELICNKKITTLSTPILTILSSIAVISALFEIIRKYIFSNVFNLARKIFSVEFDNQLIDIFVSIIYILMVIIVITTFIIFLINKEEVPTYQYILSIIEQARQENNN